MKDCFKIDKKSSDWLARRKKAAAKIHARTATVTWWHGQSLDPYGVYGRLPPELQQIQRHYFARRPGSKIWVCFDDLSKRLRDRLWKRHGHKLAFPAY